jgi:transcriptional regulator with XRE-family HTH domain
MGTVTRGGVVRTGHIESVSPLIRRRRLAGELRALRESAGLTSEQLAKLIGKSRPMVSKFETGDRVPSIADMSRLLEALGTRIDINDIRWHELIQMTKDAGERGWWEAYEPAMGARQRVYADLEYGAAVVREYQSYVIPGLLQTPAYTRARVELAHMQARLPATVERSVEAKMMRQRMLTRPGGPEYTAVIEELAFRRPAADPEVMREQLLHLVKLAEKDGPVRVRVLPQGAKLRDHWLPRGPFSIYDYHRDDPTAVAVDTETTDLIYTAPDEVQPYLELWDRVWEAVLSAADSAGLLRATAHGSQ